MHFNQRPAHITHVKRNALDCHTPGQPSIILLIKIDAKNPSLFFFSPAVRLTVFAASGVWRSCGCCGCTEGQNGAAQGHQGQCDDVPYGRQDCNPAVGLRSKPLLCRQERSVSFPNLSVSIPNLSVSVPNLSVNIPNLSVTVPNLSVSIPYLSSPSR